MKEFNLHSNNNHPLIIFRKQAWSDTVCELACQINIISIYILTASLLCIFVGLTPIAGLPEKLTSALALAGIAIVLVLNKYKKTEIAAVLFYIALNALSLVTFQLFPGQPIESILMYFLLLSLIVFLFQSTLTRVVCMTIVLLRIIIFGINERILNTSALLTFKDTNAFPRLLYDALLLVLVVLVFLLYAWKLYTLELRHRQKTQFGQQMSHDLNVCYHALASTIATINYREDNGQAPDPELRRQLTDASDYYAYILNNFLDFSRRENAILTTPQYEQVNLSQELSKIVQLYKYSAEKKGLKIDLYINKQIPDFVIGDKIRISRIVLNLLVNAINNTKPGNKITLAVNSKIKHWELTVTNDGEPLTENDFKNLFLPFEGKRKGVQKKGLGMGLPITKQMVDVLGGQIFATSENGRTIMLTVTLPHVNHLT